MGSRYIPFPAYAADAAIDISFLFADERPAGKHGFLKVQGEKFVFEDGTPGYFWGVCLNSAACFPPHDHAEKLARRLAMFGVNMVRLHQMDADFAAPNLFQFSRGVRLSGTRKLDPQSLDRVDYLIHCLKREGIYIYMDFHNIRTFRAEDGVENATKLYSGGSVFAMVDPRMIELQKEMVTMLLEHKNPYTGLAYKDEPASAMADVINEHTLFAKGTMAEPYESNFREGFRAWLAAQGIEKDVDSMAMFGNDVDADLVNYKIEKEKAYWGTMRDHMISVGAKFPITGSNFIMHSGFFASQGEMDFRDNHMYFHRFFEDTGTTWGVDSKKMEHFSLTERGDCGFTKLMHMRSLDKPFVVSEWNMTWPNQYRAEGALVYSAVCALQGASATGIHTYSYSNVQRDGAIMGKETTAAGLAGIPYREGIFACWNDPAMMGMFYHAALIMRRRDVAEAQKRIAVVADPTRGLERADFLKTAEPPLNWYLDKRFDRMAPCYYALAEISKVGTCLEVPEDVDQVFTEPQWPFDVAQTTEVRSDTGELYRSWKDNYGWIDTERTKCTYGFLGKNTAIKLKDVEIDCETDFAVIAMSSLSDAPICHSENILLTTGGRARNKNSVFDGDYMLEWGEAPAEVEVIRATIKIKTDVPNLKVLSITPEGMHQATIPSEWKDGVLSFTVGDKWGSMYYLIQQY